MDIIGTIFVTSLSILAVIGGFVSFFYAYVLSGNFIRSGALYPLIMGFAGIYGLYYVFFETLEISIK